MSQLPAPIRAALGLVATVIEDSRSLPDKAVELPVLAVSSALQLSLKLQQRYAALTVRGDEFLTQLRGGAPDEPPAWATFDDADARSDSPVAADAPPPANPARPDSPVAADAPPPAKPTRPAKAAAAHPPAGAKAPVKRAAARPARPAAGGAPRARRTTGRPSAFDSSADVTGSIDIPGADG